MNKLSEEQVDSLLESPDDWELLNAFERSNSILLKLRVGGDRVLEVTKDASGELHYELFAPATPQNS